MQDSDVLERNPLGNDYRGGNISFKTIGGLNKISVAIQNSICYVMLILVIKATNRTQTKKHVLDGHFF